jgi:hypothetical protein
MAGHPARLLPNDVTSVTSGEQSAVPPAAGLSSKPFAINALRAWHTRCTGHRPSTSHGAGPEVIMERCLRWVFAVAVLAAGVSATPASAQVRVGVHTPHIGVSVALGAPRVYVGRYDDPYYRGGYYRPLPVRGWERDRDRYRDRARREREYRRDIREAQREYERDLREARRDYARDIRDARRDRRR